MADVPRTVPPGAIPLHDFIGLSFESYADGKARVAVPLSDHLRTIAEPVHGAVYSIMCGVACGAALEGAFDPQVAIPVAVETSVRLLSQPRSWPLAAEGQLVHRGKRILSTEAVVYDGDRRQLARGSTTFAVITDYGGALAAVSPSVAPQIPISPGDS